MAEKQPRERNFWDRDDYAPEADDGKEQLDDMGQPQDGARSERPGNGDAAPGGAAPRSRVDELTDDELREAHRRVCTRAKRDADERRSRGKSEAGGTARKARASGHARADKAS